MIGRQTYLDELDGWACSASEVLELHGAFGVGKSTLITAWSTRSARRVWIVNLGGATTAEDVVDAVSARAPEGPGPIERVMARHPGIILVLDDAGGARDQLAALLTRWRGVGEGWRYVVVTRAPLELEDASTMRLGALSEAEGLELLRQRGDAESLDLAGRARTARLVRVLEGHPLALELAARRLRVCGVDEVLEHLVERAGGGHARRRMRALDQALDDAFSLSWDALEGGPQRVLAGLCVFANVCTLDALEEVALTGDEDDRHLDHLIDLGLVRRVRGTRPRFSVLRAVRPSVLERTGEQVALLRTKHAEYFAARAAHHLERDLGEDALDDLPDLLAAYDHSDDPRLRAFVAALMRRRGSMSTFATVPAHALPADTATRIVSLKQSATQLATQGHYRGARAQLEDALEHTRQEHGTSSALELELRTALVKIGARAGNTAAVAHGAEELGHLEAARGHARRAAKAYHRASRAYARMGEHTRAQAALESLFALTHEATDARYAQLLILATLDLAESLAHDDTERASSLAASIWTMGHATDDQLGRASALLGDLAMTRGDTSAALEHYTRARDARPDLHAARHHDALWRAGRTEDARATLRGASGFGVCARESLGFWLEGRDADALASAERAFDAASKREDVGAARLLMALATPPHTPLALADAMRDLGMPGLGAFADATLRALNGDLTEVTRWEVSDGLSSWFVYAMGSASRRANLTRAAKDGVVTVERSGAWVVLEDGQVVELGKKMLLRRLLITLVTRHLAQPGSAPGALELFHEVWSDEPHTSEDAAMNRLRVAIRRLRTQLGRDALVVTDDEGRYLIEPSRAITLEPQQA